MAERIRFVMKRLIYIFILMTILTAQVNAIITTIEVNRAGVSSTNPFPVSIIDASSGTAIKTSALVSVNVTLSPETSTVYRGFDMIQIDFAGYTIPTNSYIEVKYSGIASYDSIDFKIPSCSSGNITTANIIWTHQDGITALNSEVVTSGIDVTDFDSGWFTFRICNPVIGLPVLITGNILVND